jgi:hypothetical protein
MGEEEKQRFCIKTSWGKVSKTYLYKKKLRRNYARKSHFPNGNF